MVAMADSRSVPPNGRPAGRATCASLPASSSTTRACSIKRRPTAVIMTRRVVRSKRAAPSQVSILRTCADSDGCDTRHCSAAATKLPRSATATTYSRSRSDMPEKAMRFLLVVHTYISDRIIILILLSAQCESRVAAPDGLATLRESGLQTGGGGNMVSRRASFGTSSDRGHRSTKDGLHEGH